MLAAIPILGPIIDIVNQGVGMLRDHFEGKRKRDLAQLETELAIEQAKQQSAARIAEGKALHEIQWETIQAKAGESSWKDEWFTIILSLPFLLAMFGLSSWADRAFAAMSSAPEWYTYSFLVAVGASFGVRIWERFKNGGNGDKP